MPANASFSLMRPIARCRRSVSRPHQFAFMPISSAGCARIAGVHSTVWIFAISAALTMPRAGEQPVAVPVRIAALELVADRVVLAREQRVQQAEAGPPVAREAGQRASPVVVGIERAARRGRDRACRRARARRSARTAVLDARCARSRRSSRGCCRRSARRPTNATRHWRRSADICSRPPFAALFAFVVARRVGPRAADLHRAAALPPRIIVGERDLERVAR